MQSGASTRIVATNGRRSTPMARNVASAKPMWTGPSLSYTAGWEQCDAGGGDCTQIVGATGPSYTTTAADIGMYGVVARKT